MRELIEAKKKITPEVDAELEKEYSKIRHIEPQEFNASTKAGERVRVKIEPGKNLGKTYSIRIVNPGRGVNAFFFEKPEDIDDLMKTMSSLVKKAKKAVEKNDKAKSDFWKRLKTEYD